MLGEGSVVKLKSVGRHQGLFDGSRIAPGESIRGASTGHGGAVRRGHQRADRLLLLLPEHGARGHGRHQDQGPEPLRMVQSVVEGQQTAPRMGDEVDRAQAQLLS